MFCFDKKKESTEVFFNAKLLSDFVKETAAKKVKISCTCSYVTTLGT
jgi:hypothetical protein